MSDNRKKSRRRRSVDEIAELTPIEISIAKYLRSQCPTKKGVFMGSQVAYFNGSKAIECLIESKWSSISTKALSGSPANESKDPICFSSKHDAVQMLRRYIDHQLFRRVVKVYKEDKPGKEKDSEQTPSNTAGDTSQNNTPRAVRQRKSKATGTSEQSAKEDDSKEKEKGKKKKFKFESHDDQNFVDSPNDFYVWIFSPTTVKQYIVGALLVIGCIAVCLFPLWPAEVRTGVYYLSMVLASLLGVLLSLAVIKYIIFAGIWLLTLGKVRFWLLPNLTEDVGFFESFVPLYLLNVGDTKKTTEANNKNKQDAKADDDPKSNTEVKASNNESDNDDDEKKSSTRTSSIDEADDGNKQQKSSDEDFEVLSKDELETK